MSEDKLLPKAWERQPTEPQDAFFAFVHYRDSRRRKYSLTAKFLGEPVPVIEAWGTKYNWIERARAWDNEIDRRVRDKTSEDIVKMKSNHVQLAVGMQKIAALELESWLNKIEKSKAEERAKGAKAKHNPALTVDALVSLVKNGTHLERLTRGEATERTEAVSADIGRLSLDEQRLYRALLLKMRGDD